MDLAKAVSTHPGVIVVLEVRWTGVTVFTTQMASVIFNQDHYQLSF